MGDGDDEGGIDEGVPFVEDMVNGDFFEVEVSN